MHDLQTIAPPRARTFTVDEYYGLARHGILTPDDRVELIEGRVYEMSPIGISHAQCVRRLNKLLMPRVTPKAEVSIQSPVRLNDLSEPEPDVALLKPPDVYGSRHPGPEDVLLLIEAADASLKFDRTVKAPLYARAGIAELWVIALRDQQVHVYRRPGPDGYAEQTVVGRGNALAIPGLPEVEPVPVDALFD